MRRVRLNESQLRMVIRKIVNEQADMPDMPGTPGKKIVAAWRSEGRDDDEYTADRVVYVWKYEDGTGNAQFENEGTLCFRDGIKFDAWGNVRPANFIDPHRWNAKRIDPSMLPI